MSPGRHPLHDIPRIPLSYNGRLQQRALEQVDLIVVHATELPSLVMAREYGEQIHYPSSETGNSGHFYIDRDGTVEQWVDLDRVAHHVTDHNHNTVGIELVNRGRYPDWFDSRCQTWQEPVTRGQIEALLGLLDRLQQQLPALRWIAGHDVLDTRLVAASDDPTRRVRRKLDPGPDFPWNRVLQSSGLLPFRRP